MCATDSLAGTILADGTVLSGDDAAAWKSAGFPVRRVEVRCSARIAAGEQPCPQRRTSAAVDLNGSTVERIKRVAHAVAAQPATGAYNGERIPSALLVIDGDRTAAVHANLREKLPGFGCFAVLI